MSKLSTKELRRYEWLGGGLIVVGIVILMLTRLKHDPNWFWADYVKALYGWGWISVALGTVWAGLAAARGRTDFLSVEKPIAPDNMIISVVAVLIATAIACYVAVSFLPRTAPEDLPPDPKKREKILTVERNTRLFVGTFVFVVGAGVTAFPVIRHLRNANNGRKRKKK